VAPEELVEIVKDQTILRVDPVAWTCEADFDSAKLAAAALAYARPIVAKECARIVDAKFAETLGGKQIEEVGPTMAAGLFAFKMAAAAIREHGKEK